MSSQPPYKRKILAFALLLRLNQLYSSGGISGRAPKAQLLELLLAEVMKKENGTSIKEESEKIRFDSLDTIYRRWRLTPTGTDRLALPLPVSLAWELLTLEEFTYVVILAIMKINSEGEREPSLVEVRLLEKALEGLHLEDKAVYHNVVTRYTPEELCSLAKQRVFPGDQ